MSSWAQIETPDGDILFLWQVSEDGNVEHWALAATASGAMDEVCQMIDETCSPEEVDELICRRVTEEQAAGLKYYGDTQPETTMLEQIKLETKPGYFACSEY